MGAPVPVYITDCTHTVHAGEERVQGEGESHLQECCELAVDSLFILPLTSHPPSHPPLLTRPTTLLVLLPNL